MARINAIFDKAAELEKSVFISLYYTRLLGDLNIV